MIAKDKTIAQRDANCIDCLIKLLAGGDLANFTSQIKFLLVILSTK